MSTPLQPSNERPTGGGWSRGRTRELLTRLGHHPRKRLGQNFLVDGNIVRKSLLLAGDLQGRNVVEVGPGLGTLTAALLEAGAHVYAVEHDPTLAAFLRDEILPHASDRLHLLTADAVDHPRAGLPAEASDFRVVANLPYAIATPWLEALLREPLPERLVLMLQKEAADRYLATPGTKSFGAISVLLQATFNVTGKHRVPPGCFYPPPKVDSMLLALERRNHPVLFPPQARERLRALFTQRRKQLGHLLKEAPDRSRWETILGEAGLDLKTRPEAVPLPVWIRLLAPDAAPPR